MKSIEEISNNSIAYMDPRSRSFVVLVVVSLTVLHSVSTFPLGKLKTGENFKGLEPNIPGKHITKPDRFTRGTSENAQIVSTTPAPPLQQPEAEGSTETAPTSAPLCDEEARQASTCRTLKERLREDLNISHHMIQYPLEGVLNAFSLDDLIYFDLLGEGTPAPLIDTPGSYLRISEPICNSIIQHHYRPLNVDLGECAWHYTCSHSFERFPTIRIEAELNEPRHFDLVMCNQVVMQDVVYYERQDCLGDPCRTENWVKRSYDVVVGYKVTPQS